jgi:hypothetical protein
MQKNSKISEKLKKLKKFENLSKMKQNRFSRRHVQLNNSTIHKFMKYLVWSISETISNKYNAKLFWIWNISRHVILSNFHDFDWKLILSRTMNIPLGMDISLHRITYTFLWGKARITNTNTNTNIDIDTDTDTDTDVLNWIQVQKYFSSLDRYVKRTTEGEKWNDSPSTVQRSL